MFTERFIRRVQGSARQISTNIFPSIRNTQPPCDPQASSVTHCTCKSVQLHATCQIDTQDVTSLSTEVCGWLFQARQALLITDMHPSFGAAPRTFPIESNRKRPMVGLMPSVTSPAARSVSEMDDQTWRDVPIVIGDEIISL